MKNSKLLFTQAAIFHLASINNLLRRKTGHTYRMSDEASIYRLVDEAMHSDDVQVLKHLDRLMSHLSPAQAETLGISMAA